MNGVPGNDGRTGLPSDLPPDPHGADVAGSVDGVSWLGWIPVYYQGSKNIERGDQLTGYGALHLEERYIDAFSDNYWVEKEEKPEVTSVVVKPSEAKVNVEEFENFYAIATYSNGENKYVTDNAEWTVEPPNIGGIAIIHWLSVEPPYCAARFHAENAGKGTIAANYHGYSNTAEITVENKPLGENIVVGELDLEACSDERKVGVPLENVGKEVPPNLYTVDVFGSVNGVTWFGWIPVYYEGSKNIEKGDNLTGYGALHIEKGYIDAFSDNYWIVIKMVMPQVKAESVTVQPGENAVSRISLSEAPNGLSGYKMTVRLGHVIPLIFEEENLTAAVENEGYHVSIPLAENDPLVEYVENITQLFPPGDAADIGGVSFPEWATISNVERLGPDSVRIEAVDLDEKKKRNRVT